jgi:Major Facilitator Superfamily
MAPLTTRLANAAGDSSQRKLLAASFADALGTGLFLPLSVIYLTRIVGLSPARVGLGLTIAGVVAIAASPLSGALLGRFDARKVVLGCFAASACGFLAYIAVGSFASFLGVAIVIQFASRMDRPAKTVLTLGLTPRPRQVDALARQSSLRNLGYGLGGLLAALALLVHGKTPFVVLLAANAGSYALASLLVLRLPAALPPERAEGDEHGYAEVIRDRPYMRLALLNVIMALNDSLLLVAMPLWIVTRTRAPLSLTGLLFALNTILVVLFQVRTTRNMAARGGIARGYRTAAVSFVVACGAFALAAGEPTIVATVLLVFAISALPSAELVASAGEWFLSVQLAPTRLSAPYISVFKMSMAVQQAVGPALVTAVLVGWGRLGWLAFALLLTAGTLTSRRLGAREINRRVSPTPQTPLSKDSADADELRPDPRPMPSANYVGSASRMRASSEPSTLSRRPEML